MRSFTPDFTAELTELFRWRRDVRRFQKTPIPDALVTECLDLLRHAPSVGLSAPWRLVNVHSDAARAAAIANFEAANAQALSGYSGEQAERYAGLKLSGMQDAPVHLAVFCDDATVKGSGLGAGTMPQMRAYSVVGAIMYLWLGARARGLGLGWVSILDPEQLCADLDVPEDWALVGYLCMGWPEIETETPELIRAGWETEAPKPEVLLR
ncbi:cob(II)yrinic acid a,c-diamide reductase [Monaibacterium marinum]|uniref:Cob(II)yrinic acid a,c-diamide reductase n=1 Tax=Pontivivens marinum TaxID=1690039 RepID=A0A2C9CSS3_9RHOB|nr:5,6-dimethylbenzimidazole synthase [Monaibacterium marinum]SOH94215.1 cob(II)yrinic acid a,c-diamide reductase [Monaibacterium marinum]